MTAVTSGQWRVTRKTFDIRIVVLLALLVCVASTVRAQTGAATVSGLVTDQSGAVIVKAELELKSVDKGTTFTTKSNDAGIYVFTGIQPGNYQITIRKAGFKQVDLLGLILNTQDHLEQNFRLELGSVSESVTVNAETTNESPAVSMAVTREFVENTPLNGRSFQDLIQLAPGTVNAANGYYTVDGQRTESNNYTVDGVSANLGGYNNSAGGGPNGSTPPQTVLGTTQALVSVDALQEFQIQTSGYTAEYGRTPGGQLQFTTRSGTNDFHGTLFEYFRNTAFDANSYLNNYHGIPKTAEHQNDFGGTVGGPIIIPKLYDGKNKTFFFFSYEGLRLLLPTSETEYVPTQAFRQWASQNVQPFLNSVPLPNGPINQDGCTVPGTTDACDALFSYAYSYPNVVNNINFRLDQTIGQHVRAFIRYADTPSSSTNGAESVTRTLTNVHTLTAGLTASISDTLLNDFRFNYSHDGEGEFFTQSSVGGSIPLPRSEVIPTAYDGPYANGSALILIPGTGLLISSGYGGAGTVQHQYQFVDTVNWTRGKHGLKFGADWRRLTPFIEPGGYNSNIGIESLADIQNGYATTAQIEARAPGRPVFDNLSLFAQDHWKVGARLSLDYGLRWEFNPAPGPSNGHYPITLTSDNLTTAEVAPVGTPPFKTLYDHFAPRVGFAWNAVRSVQHPLTVRGGYGIFYDMGTSVIGLAYTGSYPFGAFGPTQTEVPLPLSNAALTPPSLNVPLVPPYPPLNVSSPNLTLPYTEQWNLSLDEALSAKNTLTISYVGNAGKRLLFTRYYGSSPELNPDFAGGINAFTDNGSKSTYNALQLQDTGQITNGLDLVASFTWAHALDNASQSLSDFNPQWGNSDNDLRRVFNLALNYQSHAVGANHWMHALTGGWLVANRFSAQSGYPVNMAQLISLLPDGTATEAYPDLIPGVPIYLHGSAADVDGRPVPGSWRLNPAAFATVPIDPSTGNPIRQGTLGRNFVHGPGFWTLNTAVQRNFPIYERLHLIFRVEAFNIFNHPNPNTPDTNLADSTFGELTYIQTLGSSYSFYSMGVARSLQFSLKLQF